jgi:hypothetical protein
MDIDPASLIVGCLVGVAAASFFHSRSQKDGVISAAKNLSKNCRRIVTGHDADGNAVVLSDSHCLNFKEPPMRDGVQVRQQ